MRVHLLLLAVALVFGGCCGLAGGLGGSYGFGLRPPAAAMTASDPMPHFVPKYEGGASLRYAMVHDVIHERYPVRGPAYYKDRDRRAREKLKTLPPDSQEAFDLADDLGVGLDKLGRPGEGVPILRDKLARQQNAGQTGRALYTTYANLGTFLIHANMKAALAADATAKEQVQEGLAFLRKSIQVNPEAHFGREEWQLRIGEHLLACAADPARLTTFDCVGNRFAAAINPDDQTAIQKDGGHEYDWYFGKYRGRIAPDGTLAKDLDRNEVRSLIRRVGDPGGRWSPDGSVPFDEPTLGIVGMWRQGGGANPYFAVTLGEIMLRVGQRYVAWTAYERAALLADRYGWATEHAAFLRDHCRRRQGEIEQQLPAAEVATLRPRFEAELAHGQRFQPEYQQYEADRIAAGADPHDDHFFDDFYRGREPIATPVGPAEWFARSDPAVVERLRARTAWANGLLWGGGTAFAVVLLGRVIAWLRRRGSI